MLGWLLMPMEQGGSLIANDFTDGQVENVLMGGKIIAADMEK